MAWDCPVFPRSGIRNQTWGQICKVLTDPKDGCKHVGEKLSLRQWKASISSIPTYKRWSRRGERSVLWVVVSDSHQGVRSNPHPNRNVTKTKEILASMSLVEHLLLGTRLVNQVCSYPCSWKENWNKVIIPSFNFVVWRLLVTLERTIMREQNRQKTCCSVSRREWRFPYGDQLLLRGIKGWIQA